MYTCTRAHNQYTTKLSYCTAHCILSLEVSRSAYTVSLPQLQGLVGVVESEDSGGTQL